MVKDAIANLGDLITNLGTSIVNGFKSIIEYLFVPSDNIFSDVQDMFNEKFGIFNQVSNLLKTLTFADDSAKPNFNIKLYGKTMKFIDFSFFDDYRTFIHNVILMIAYFKFIIWVVNNAPAVVTGTGGSLSEKGGSE